MLGRDAGEGVLRAVAKARGESAEELARATTETANAFFGINDRA